MSLEGSSEMKSTALKHLREAERRRTMSRRVGFSRPVVSLVVSLVVLALTWRAWRPPAAHAATVSNPLCPVEDVTFNASTGADIIVPDDYTVTVFAKGLNFPTGIAFR